MKKAKYILSLAALLMGTQLTLPTAHARKSDFAAGIILGEPTGLSVKYWSNDSRALTLGLAYSLRSYALVNLDYLWHFGSAVPAEAKNATDGNVEWQPYVGVGAGVSLGTNALGLSLRIPVGFEAILATTPLGIFLEAVPTMSIIPATAWGLGGGVGVRYYL